MRKLLGPALLVVSVVLSLLLAEAGVRLLAPQQLIYRDHNIWQPDPVLGWSHVPNANSLLNTGEGPVRFMTDENGYRINTQREPRKDFDFRVLGLGDSFLEATQVENKDTMLEVLRRKLEKNLNITVEAVNAGVGGWDPNQYLLQAQRSLAKDRFDMGIVFIYVDNDLVSKKQDRYAPVSDIESHSLRLPRGLNRKEIINALLYPINDSLEVRSHLFVFLKSSLEVLLGRLGLTSAYFPFGYQLSQAHDPVWGVTADVCADIKSLFDQHKTPVTFVLLPAPYQVHTSMFETYRAMFDIDPKTLSLDQPNNILTRELSARGLTVVDTLAALRQAAEGGDLLYGSISKHFNSLGHEVVAKHLYRAFIAHGTLSSLTASAENSKPRVL